jgi:hypothetical protein
MSRRFVPGLLMGASASGIAYAARATPVWTVAAGISMALLVWFGPPAIEWIADLIDDLT